MNMEIGGLESPLERQKKPAEKKNRRLEEIDEELEKLTNELSSAVKENDQKKLSNNIAKFEREKKKLLRELGIKETGNKQDSSVPSALSEAEVSEAERETSVSPEIESGVDVPAAESVPEPVKSEASVKGQPDLDIEAKEDASEVEKKKSFWENTKDILSNTDIQKQTAKTLISSAASIWGIKSFYDVPEYFRERFKVRGMFGKGKGLEGSIEELIATAQEGQATRKLNKEKVEGEENKPSKVKDAVKDLNDRLKLTKEGDQKDSEQRKLIAKLLWENRHQEENSQEERHAEITEILDDYTNTKVTGIQATRESLNTLFVASGAMGLRGLSYGAAALIERGQRIEKAMKKEGKENEKMEGLKRIFVDGLKETFQGALIRGKGSRKEKTLKAVKSYGTLLRFVGITSTMSLSPENYDIDKILDNISEKGFGGLGKDFLNNIAPLRAAKKVGNALFGAEEAGVASDLSESADVVSAGGDMPEAITEVDNIEKIKEMSEAMAVKTGLTIEDLSEAAEDGEITNEEIINIQSEKLGGFEIKEPLSADEFKILQGEDNSELVKKILVDGKPSEIELDIIKSQLPDKIKFTLLDESPNQGEVFKIIQDLQEKNPELVNKVLADGEINETELNIIKSGLPDKIKLALLGDSPNQEENLKNIQGIATANPEILKGFNELAGDEEIVNIVQVPKGGNISEALAKPMGGEATVTIINPDGTKIVDFDADLVHSDDMVVETTDGEIYVFKTSGVEVKEGMSLGGVYEEIQNNLDKEGVPQEVQDYFNTNREKSGFLGRIDKIEAEKASEFWEKNGKRIDKLSDEGREDFYKNTDFNNPEEVEKQLIDLEEKTIVEGIEEKIPDMKIFTGQENLNQGAYEKVMNKIARGEGSLELTKQSILGWSREISVLKSDLEELKLAPDEVQERLDKIKDILKISKDTYKTDIFSQDVKDFVDDYKIEEAPAPVAEDVVEEIPVKPEPVESKPEPVEQKTEAPPAVEPEPAPAVETPEPVETPSKPEVTVFSEDFSALEGDPLAEFPQNKLVFADDFPAEDKGNYENFFNSGIEERKEIIKQLGEWKEKYGDRPEFKQFEAGITKEVSLRNNLLGNMAKEAAAGTSNSETIKTLQSELGKLAPEDSAKMLLDGQSTLVGLQDTEETAMGAFDGLDEARKSVSSPEAPPVVEPEPEVQEKIIEKPSAETIQSELAKPIIEEYENSSANITELISPEEQLQGEEAEDVKDFFKDKKPLGNTRIPQDKINYDNSIEFESYDGATENLSSDLQEAIEDYNNEVEKILDSDDNTSRSKLLEKTEEIFKTADQQDTSSLTQKFIETNFSENKEAMKGFNRIMQKDFKVPNIRQKVCFNTLFGNREMAGYYLNAKQNGTGDQVLKNMQDYLKNALEGTNFAGKKSVSSARGALTFWVKQHPFKP